MYIIILLFYMNKLKSAFSLIEILVSVSIIILLWIIGLSFFIWDKENTYNSKTSADLETVKNSFLSYINAWNELPKPDGNVSYFSMDTWYSHSLESNNTYWMHWLLSQKILPKNFLDYTPINPKTNQFYAYWKLKEKQEFELAWIIYNKQEPESIVIWNYIWENWPINLIREYNGAYFVNDRSKESFPYNPSELLLIWKIWAYSWTVKIDWYQWDILKKQLITWDKIIVGKWWSTEIFFSDGSRTILWDNEKESILEITKLSYIEKNNLATKIILALNVWTLWTKASELNNNSEFEIFTQDTTAAIKWTIFGISKNTNETKITLVVWKLDIKENRITTPWISLSEDYNNGKISKTPINESILSWSILEVKEWEEIKYISIKKQENGSENQIYNGSIIDNNEINNIFKQSQEYKSLNNINLDIKNIYSSWSEKIFNLYLYNIFNNNIVIKDKDKDENEIECNNWKCICKNNCTWIKRIKICNNNNILSSKINCTWYKEFDLDSNIITNPTKQKIDHTELKNEIMKENLKDFNINYEKIDNSITVDWITYKSSDNPFFHNLWFNLVAVAPYDIDVNLYTWSTNDNKIIAEYNLKITDTTDSFFSNIKNIYDTSNNLNIYWYNDINWVFLSNNNYIKYSSNWFFDWNFAIEMNVKGLDRENDKEYTLFKIWSNKLYINHNKLYYYNNNYNNNNDLNIFNNDKSFHKVIFIKKNNDIKIYIDEKLVISYTSDKSLNFSKDIYIGNNINYNDTSYINQWNDIIDYIKIYN